MIEESHNRCKQDDADQENLVGMVSENSKSNSLDSKQANADEDNNDLEKKSLHMEFNNKRCEQDGIDQETLENVVSGNLESDSLDSKQSNRYEDKTDLESKYSHMAIAQYLRKLKSPVMTILKVAVQLATVVNALYHVFIFLH